MITRRDLILFVSILLTFCCVHSVNGGECCRVREGTFWCPDHCCYQRTNQNGRVDTVESTNYVTYDGSNTLSFFCCSDGRQKAPRAFTTSFCSSWFSHPDNIWVPILVAVILVLLFIACGICCCFCPGRCKGRRFAL